MLARIFILCMSVVSTNHAVTFDRAKILFSHLQNVSGYHVKLLLEKSTEVNAWVDSPYSITITTGLLDFCNENQLIMVMGHELGHIIRRDYRSNSGSYKQELSADNIGYYYCTKLKYSNKQCLSFMYKMRWYYGEQSDDVHPKWSTRISNLER